MGAGGGADAENAPPVEALTGEDAPLATDAAVGELLERARRAAAEGRPAPQVFPVSVAGQLARPMRETVAFAPHPRTLTAAGDLEYFASQGRHPFVYALAELVDNALAATARNAGARDIAIHLLHAGKGEGMVVVSDNGRGMGKQALNDWAVMNLSMEDRGLLDRPGADAPGGGGAAGPGRYLNSNLSFFGVGSKNASFYVGDTVRVTTKRREDLYVHELCLDAKELESKYWASQNNAYTSEMVHRHPGDASTLGAREQKFAFVRDAVGREAADAQFTRIVITGVKAEVLAQIRDRAAGEKVCRDLAHLYHFYLHGEQGSVAARPPPPGGGAPRPPAALPDGTPLPSVRMAHCVNSRELWSAALAEVRDDPVSCILEAQRAEFAFSFEVPDRGVVQGVLFYFPHEKDGETVPQDGPSRDSIGSLRSSGPAVLATQAGGRGLHTQLALTAAGATQARPIDLDGLVDEAEAGALRPAALFQVFWQGRLVPESGLASLPFIDEVRDKRNEKVRDVLPDEAFLRIRGFLFFGPRFKVTRNKLSFRDNLSQMLGQDSALSKDRHVAKRFREWLTKCHQDLDKTIHFQGLSASKEQARARAELGEHVTLFNQVTIGKEAYKKGDVVKLRGRQKSAKIVGRALHFGVDMAVRAEGTYSNGFVTVQPLPVELHGAVKPFDQKLSLRRLEAVLDEQETAKHEAAELQKLPRSISLEPLSFMTSQVLKYSAGTALPATCVSVHNGAKSKLVRSLLKGKKHNLQVVQRLRFLGASPKAAPEAAETQEPPAPAPRRYTRRRGKNAREAPRDEEETESNTPPAPAGPLLEVVNAKPKGESFQFQKVSSGLQLAGYYELEYAVVADGATLIQHAVTLHVRPGSPAGFVVAGDLDKLKDTPLPLGTYLPPFQVRFQDAYENPCAAPPGLSAEDVAVHICPEAAAGGALDFPVEASASVTEAGGVELRDVVIRAKRCNTALTQLFLHSVKSQGQLKQLHPPDGADDPTVIKPVPVQLIVSVGEFDAYSVPVDLCPGIPAALTMLPGHPFTGKAVMHGAVGSLKLPAGSRLPDFSIAMHDEWGFRTASRSDVRYRLVVYCPALVPETLDFEFDSQAGTAVVQGFAVGAFDPDPAKLLIALQVEGQSTYSQVPETMLQTKSTANATQTAAGTLQCELTIEPNNDPASMELRSRSGEVTHETLGGEEAPETVATLSGVRVGAKLGDLSLALLDSAQRPVVDTKGKLSTSWGRGSKKVKTDANGFVALPALKVPEQVGPMDVWVKLTMAGVTLELSGVVAPHAGPPVRWQISTVASSESQEGEAAAEIRCGEPFALDIEAVDAFYNRCSWPADAAERLPAVVPTSARPLTFDPAEDLKLEWLRTEDGEKALQATLVLRGDPGPIAIAVQDRPADEAGAAPGGGGDGEVVDLTPFIADEMTLTLVPGPPKRLGILWPEAECRCWTQSLLAGICVQAEDCAGNLATAANFEVVLATAAVHRAAGEGEEAGAGGGKSASVSVKGGNRKKLANGFLRLGDVKFVAPVPGTYELKAQSGSRKESVEPAFLAVEAVHSNRVVALEVLALAAAEIPAGAAVEVRVAVTTEDGAPVPFEDLRAGLRLSLAPPLEDGVSPGEPLVLELPDGGAGAEGGVYTCTSPALEAAGAWSASAEYQEPRAGLALPGAKGKGKLLKSVARPFAVLPGPPHHLSFEAELDQQLLAVSNAGAEADRVLLQGAAFQLRDEFGNSAAAAGLEVVAELVPAATSPPRKRYREADAPAEDPPPLPVRVVAGTCATDAAGRAYLGDLRVEPAGDDDGGAAAAAAAGGQCFMQLVVRAPGAEGVEPWAVDVVFTDDQAQHRAQSKLAQRLAELEDKLDAEEGQRARLQAELRKEQGRLDAADAAVQRLAAQLDPLPASRAAAERALQECSKTASQGGRARARKAKLHKAAAKVQQELQKARQRDQLSIRGWAVEDMICSDDELAVALSLLGGGVFSKCLLVETSAHASKLKGHLRKKGLDRALWVWAEDQMNEYVPTSGRSSSQKTFSHAAALRGALGDRARALHRDALDQSDQPLDIAMPHHHLDPGAWDGLAQWPPGFVGHVCNLVRPKRAGTRSTVVYGVFSNTMVFQTEARASEYRKKVVQLMKRQPRMRSMPAIVCLAEGTKFDGRGIVSPLSATWPMALDQMPCLLGGVALAAGLQANAQKLQLLEEFLAADAAREEAREVSLVGTLERDLEAAGAALARLGTEQAELRAELERLGVPQEAEEGAASPGRKRASPDGKPGAARGKRRRKGARRR